MTMILENHGRFARWVCRLILPTVLLSLSQAGCAQRHVGPGLIANQRLGSITIAVAPAINESGSTDFDPEHFADEMANELGYVDGINVVPVSRVLDVMREHGWDQVESAAHALQIADLLGADAMLVFAVTTYNAYDPPRIGVAAQLFGRGRDGGSRLDPVKLSQSAASTESPRREEDGVLAQAARVFDASHEDLIRDLKGYAAERNAGDNPYGYRWYVISQRRFMQYCCNATIRLLLADGTDGAVTVKAQRTGPREKPEQKALAAR